MVTALSIASDVLAAATALAGLTLVFLGGISADYGRYEKVDRSAVRSRFARRAWFSFASFIAALASSLFALSAEWTASEGCAIAAALCLIFSLLTVAFLGLMTVQEID